MTALCQAAAVTASIPVLAGSVILLRLADGRIAAWRNACPHMGIELDWEPSRLLTRAGRYLVCTGHGALFEPATGLCVQGPCQGEALSPVPIRIEAGMVVRND